MLARWTLTPSPKCEGIDLAEKHHRLVETHFFKDRLIASDDRV
jgi:hypothetical protein